MTSKKCNLFARVCTIIYTNSTTFFFLPFHGCTVISSTSTVFLGFLKCFSFTSKENIFRFLHSLKHYQISFWLFIKFNIDVKTLLGTVAKKSSGIVTMTTLEPYKTGKDLWNYVWRHKYTSNHLKSNQLWHYTRVSTSRQQSNDVIRVLYLRRNHHHG